MLNLEQVIFNIIGERMQKPRTQDERERGGGGEHLCHCYACCLVTTFFTVQQTEAMHEENLPLREKSEDDLHFYFSTEDFEDGICVQDPVSLCGFHQHKQLLTVELTCLSLQTHILIRGFTCFLMKNVTCL